ncbi:hypothetical protein, partial [Ralstonia pseudosolanacearum]|uniref:hypothetical protein n=1 Tax=Ralstonia pseudosolanacearum TaxID=1310165 RepID=UPI003CEA9ED4
GMLMPTWPTSISLWNLRAAAPLCVNMPTPSATASSNEQQRTRQAAAKAVVPAPKKQAPKLVAAGGDESDWETF